MWNLNNKAAIILHDFVMAALAWQLAWWLRFNFAMPDQYFKMSLYTLPLAVLIQGLVYQRFKLHRGLWRFASLRDLWNIFRAAFFGALFITVVLFISIRLIHVPRSILVLYPIFLIFLLGAPRLGYRMWKDHSFKFNTVSGDKRVLIIGAGRAGEMLVRDMLREGSYIPVGFIDDNLELKNSEIHGVRVMGTVDDLPRLAVQREADIVVIAVPSASNQQMQRIINQCEHTGCELRTLPRIHDMVSGRVTLNELREVSIEDLLGREKVELDLQIIQQGLTGKVVMVSGGGGSIGSELCLQIARLGPAELVIFERSEFNLYNVTRTLQAAHPALKLHAILGDLCDRIRINEVMSRFRPDVIFHAAAYKHVPILQYQVREAVRNNVLATIYLAESALANECGKFVFISTDKAVNPANVLGATKRVAEMYCEWKNRHAKTRFITVRFGNVLDSAGSVVPLFREQIKQGGPVTVTHPEITRFFMTIPEASQLILQAGAMGKGGEIYVLDMGEPVKISYLAEQMIRFSGKEPGEDIKIIYTGLRPGEKLYEELFYADEDKQSTTHPKILLARHAELDPAYLAERIQSIERGCAAYDEEGLQKVLDELAPIGSNSTRTSSNVIDLNIAKK